MSTIIVDKENSAITSTIISGKQTAQEVASPLKNVTNGNTPAPVVLVTPAVQVAAVEAPKSPIAEVFARIMSIVGASASNPRTFEVTENIVSEFIQVILQLAATHAEYRGGKEIGVTDLLETLRTLGRPIYWRAQVEEEMTFDDAEGDAMEAEEEDDEEFDDEEEDGADAMEEDSEDAEDGTGYVGEQPIFQQFVKALFERVVRGGNFSLGGIVQEGYDVIQSASEDYLGKLFESARIIARHGGHAERVEPEDIRCVLAMWGTVPGGNELVRRVGNRF